ISSDKPAQWDVAHRDGSRRQPLFQACYQQPCRNGDKVANRQPITAKPVVKANTRKVDVRYAPSLLVYFGSGQFIAENDQASDDPQSFYAVWDSGKGALERDNLVAQQISVSANGGRSMSQNRVAYDENRQQSGWYIDLPDARERVINRASIGFSSVLFTTIIPDSATCNAGPDGFVMAVNAFTGGKLPFNPFVSTKTGQSLDMSGMRLGAMPSALSFFQSGDGNATAVYADQNSQLYKVKVRGPDVPSRITSWAPLTN
ncbi:MAG: hypothetical protein OIF38_03195, partial [Cellvibrionaceae bacterium]|nr:hypothetical protein [Cellvibrionaceae bacterium]